MKLYHGGLIPVEDPKIIQNEIGRDFGFAFYATDIRGQAERWALRRKRTAVRNGHKDALAVVSVFDFDDEAARRQLSFRDFPDADMAWLDLVVSCRSDKSYRHGFDIVTGKIANDNVGETIAYVIAGIMRREDAVERLRFQKINNQIAFCSEHALHFLKFNTSYTRSWRLRMIEHNLVRATVIPEIVKILCRYYDISEDEALKRFYESKTAENYADDETGLYGQSALHLAGLYIVEKDGSIDLTRI